VLAGFGGILVVVLTAPGAALGGSGPALAAIIVAPVLWAAGSLAGSRGERMPSDAVAGGAIQLLAGGTAMLLLAAVAGQLSPGAWDGVSGSSLGAAGFLLVADSLAGFLLYTQLLRTAPLGLVSTYAYTTPLVAATIGVVALGESLWAGAVIGAAIVIGAVALEVRATGRRAPST
jgi:drug/metabolite transporter (DMT)-like permease